jgi:hypothetical protein
MTSSTAFPAAVVFLAALSGCGFNKNRLAYVKSPEATPCTDADCPTLEIPAPNHDDMFNPASAGVTYLDGVPVKHPFIMGSHGHIWYVMKVNPGKHTVKVLGAGTNLIGGIVNLASDALPFEAQRGRRYWLFFRAGWAGYTAKTWLEEGVGARPIVAGERDLEPRPLRSYTSDAELRAQEGRLEVWWSMAPAADQVFQSPQTERVYADGPR